MSNRKVSGSLITISLLTLGIITVFLSMVFVKLNATKPDCTEMFESIKRTDSMRINELKDSVQYLRTHPVHDTITIPKDTTTQERKDFNYKNSTGYEIRKIRERPGINEFFIEQTYFSWSDKDDDYVKDSGIVEKNPYLSNINGWVLAKVKPIDISI